MGIVAFNFSPRNSPRNLTQVTIAMKPGQGCMIWLCFGEESNFSRRIILKIELELNNLNSFLSRSAVTPVFPCCGVLRCAAVRCSVLQCEMLRYGYNIIVLRCVAVCCSVLQCEMMRYEHSIIVLQCVAVCFSVLQCIAM